jgi:hypothetical protein
MELTWPATHLRLRIFVRYLDSGDQSRASVQHSFDIDSSTVLTQTGARTAGKSASSWAQAPETEVHRAFSAPTSPRR